MEVVGFAAEDLDAVPQPCRLTRASAPLLTFPESTTPVAKDVGLAVNYCIFSLTASCEPPVHHDRGACPAGPWERAGSAPRGEAKGSPICSPSLS
jgi:hypothetical protein